MMKVDKGQDQSTMVENPSFTPRKALPGLGRWCVNRLRLTVPCYSGKSVKASENSNSPPYQQRQSVWELNPSPQAQQTVSLLAWYFELPARVEAE